MKRWLLSLLLLLACATLALLVLATTQAGANWTLAIARAFTPGELSWRELRGSLSGPLTVSELHYANDGFSADMREVELVPKISRLLGGTLDIETAVVKDLRITTRADHQHARPAPPHRLIPVVKLKLRDLSVQGLTLKQGNAASPLTLKRLAAAFVADGHKLQITRLVLNRNDGEFAVNGNVDLAGNYTVQLNTRWTVMLPGRPVLRGHGRIHGNLDRLDVDQTLAAPSQVKASATLAHLLNKPQWHASLRFDALDLSRFEPRWPPLILRGGVKAADDGTGLQLQADFDASMPRSGTWSTTLAVRRQSARAWQVNKLSLSQGDRSISADGVINWNGTQPPQIDLQGQWHGLAWPLQGRASVRSDTGRFTLKGTPSDYRVQAEGGFKGGSLPVAEWRLQGHGDRERFAAEQMSARFLGGQVKAKADIAWQPSLQWHTHGDWQGLAYTTRAGRHINSPSGSFSMDADSPDRYRFSLDANSDADGLPPVTWSVTGHGTRTEVIIDKTEARSLKGRLQAKGTVRLSPQPGWNLALSGSDFDPSAQWAKWPGKLALTADTEGRVVNGKLQATLTLGRLAGTLRGYPFSADAKLGLADGDFQLQKVEVRSGRSRLSASGQMTGRRLNGTWTLTSRNLSELLPDAGGSVESRGHIGGTAGALAVDASLRGHALQAGDLHADTVDSTLSISDAGTRAFKLELHAGGLRYRQHALASLTVSGNGTDKAHQIEIHAAGKDGRAELTVRGGLDAKRLWTGQVEQGTVQGPAIGAWRLAQAFAVKAGSDHIHAARECWQAAGKDQGELCLEGDWNKAGGWTAGLDVKAIALSRFDPWLPTPISAVVTAKLNASGTGAALRTLRGNVHASAGHVRLPKRYATTPEVFAFRGADLTLRSGNAESESAAAPLTATLSIVPETPGVSPLHANLHLPTLAVTTVTPLNGEVSTTMTDLGWIGTVFPELDEVKGRVAVNLKIAGRVGKPQLQGKIVMNGSATVPRYGLQLSRIEMTGNGNDSGLDLSGNIDSGEGPLHLSGRAELDAAKGWPLKLHIEGKRFKAADIPEVWMLVSPKLDLSSRGRDIKLRGEVTIPEAKLEPKLESGAIPLSKDVVVVSAKPAATGATAAKRQGWRIDSRVKVRFGDKVTLKTPILNGRLTGSLLVRDTPDSATTATGEVQIVDGDIGAYGQKLKIARGRIVFAGGPLDDPGLDLRASRSVGSVTAGVLIQGRLNQPSTSLFSQPSMSDADTLSYLLLGQPMQQASAADGQTLLQAAASLGLEHSDLVTARIAHTLGLEHLSVQKDSSSGNLAVSIGKYLAPKLYVSYGLGLLQSSNVVKLRYELSRRWSIEAESGTGTGADVLYNLER